MGPGQIEKMGTLDRELAQIRFGRLYRDQGRAILAYALRRVEGPEDAAESSGFSANAVNPLAAGGRGA
jgi:hypothetical protein